jgi:hypothetical protein
VRAGREIQLDDGVIGRRVIPEAIVPVIIIQPQDNCPGRVLQVPHGRAEDTRHARGTHPSQVLRSQEGAGV